MNPSKIENDLFRHDDHQPDANHFIAHQFACQPHHNQFEASIEDSSSYSFPSIPDLLFGDEDDEDNDSDSPSSSDLDDRNQPKPTSNAEAGVFCTATTVPPLDFTISVDSESAKRSDLTGYINPEPHISSQFYTFNSQSHTLMLQCLLEGRLATADEIRAATPSAVLSSWRVVWKDRNEDTAYFTAWKRIQDKLAAHVDANGQHFLCFRNNNQQFVSHVGQWQDIVMSYHGSGNLKHLGLKETIERIKQVWTVGAKFYGIPESFIRVCVASCDLCSDSSASGGRTKRRRFQYTESFDVPAKEVPHKLQQLATKHKVVLCIRQKYIRHKPFMAEVKDYACHRAGEPASKKSKVLKREPYASKRCGCGFRIRAIVPISNYNEKDKSFVYEEEGTAVFKLYAVHSGHEPGPMDGNARIMHRIVGHKGSFWDHDTYGIQEEADNERPAQGEADEGNLQRLVLRQVQELRAETELLEGKITRFPKKLLGSISDELLGILSKVKSIGGCSSSPLGFTSNHRSSNDRLTGEEGHLGDWSDDQRNQIYGDIRETELIDEDGDTFHRTLDDVTWDDMRSECTVHKDMMADACKSEKWFTCTEFGRKTLVEYEDAKLIRPAGHDEPIDLVNMQVDDLYSDNPKWYGPSCALDSSADCLTHNFQHGDVV